MQAVQTRIRLEAPLTIARTVCKLMFQRRLVTLCAWLMRLPNFGPRPQTSHTFAIVVLLLRVETPVYQLKSEACKLLSDKLSEPRSATMESR